MPELLKNYLLVAKPGIILGNLVTTAGGFFLASRGCIETSVMMPVLSGISLVVACGCVFNNCIDRSMDRKMTRTRNRVLAQGLIAPKAAVCYAALLGATGTALLWTATNLLSVAVVLSGLAIYVGVYSLYLKRCSIYATMIGSLAGAAPPLAGYCTVTNRFDLGALTLLLIFSLWQMPHCYAIAIFRLDDYASTDIPVVPVRQGILAAKRHIAGYVVAFVAATLMLTLGGYTGYDYLAVAATLGLCWLYLAWAGFRTADDGRWAKGLFVFSFMSIFALSIMMSIDCTAPPATVNMLVTCTP